MKTNAHPPAKTAGSRVDPKISADGWVVLLVLTLVYTLNIADRFVMSTLIEPIKLEFHLSDGQVALLTGAVLAIFYVAAGIPLGLLADRTSRKRLIMVSLAAWSILTGICGLTRGFGQLLFARIFVGIGEAGGTPPSQSLLSDKFAPGSRGFAMSLYAIGAAAGAALGASLGGLLNDLYGWRVVLIVFGAMGLPLFLLVAATVREPARGAMDDGPTAEKPVSVMEALSYVRHNRALIHILAGTAVVTFWGWGLVWWTPAFLLRSHDMSLSVSGGHLGMMHAIGGGGVTLATAWILHAARYKGAAFQARFVAWATILPTIPSIIAFQSGSATVSLCALWIFVPMTYLYIGPTLAITQNLVPATMRSQACAFILFVANVANLAIAPLLLGEMSDMLAPYLADPGQSLRWVLVASAFTGFWGAWHYWAAARAFDRVQSAA
ncbi:MAG: MFS transporter [Sphingobium sp.]